jgi:hypothetical protein
LFFRLQVSTRFRNFFPASDPNGLESAPPGQDDRIELFDGVSIVQLPSIPVNLNSGERNFAHFRDPELLRTTAQVPILQLIFLFPRLPLDTGTRILHLSGIRWMFFCLFILLSGNILQDIVDS